ncbi:MAG: YciI family protein [Thermosynechococcaceae cyanobacterium MS004]|nr:YciI family protein [Thermosynechococcaceae cyanobacterium MS004]
MPWFVKIERGIVDKSTFDQFVPAHKAYVESLNTAGHQAKTGYWKESRGGMLLFQAQDLAQAQALVQEDPLVLNHCVEYDLHEWVQV